MKRIFRLSVLSLVALFALFTLASCSGVSQKMADDINAKAEAKEYYTYDELVKKLGEPTKGLKVDGGDLFGVTGAVIWAKGFDDWDSYQEAVDEGKTVKVLTVTFLNGKATIAAYGDNTED